VQVDAVSQADLFTAGLPPAVRSGVVHTALSLLQPWPWAIFEAGKRLENRSQKGGGLPMVCRHRGPLWLHASKREPKWYWEESCRDMLEAGLVSLPGFDADGLPELPGRGGVARGAIVGRCVVVGHVSAQRVPKTASNGRARIEMNIHASVGDVAGGWQWHRERQQRLWWGEGYALILTKVHKLRTPVPCKGSQGLWRVQPETAAQLEGAELIPCAA
jgi:hypothetical protein